MKGIYGYYDKKDKSIVYIGKDSRIENNTRHKAHKNPSKYNEQVFNRVLQNNPNRYVYKRLYVCSSHLDEVDLNGLEMQYIEALNPKFNFTMGGDGIGGYNRGRKFSDKHKKNLSKSHKGNTHLEETKKKISESMKKKYARVIKEGLTPKGKKRYGLRYDGKTIKKSVDFDKLQKMADDINKTKLEVH